MPSPRVEFCDELTTPLNSALLYRLNGDLNPIHVDPVAARKAGFERPILHGLCTYGVVGYLLTRSVCGHDPARLRSLGARFSAPVYPGETIRIEGCRSDGAVHFQATVPERQAGRPEPGLRAHRLSAAGCASLRVASDRYGSVPSLLSPALAGAQSGVAMIPRTLFSDEHDMFREAARRFIATRDHAVSPRMGARSGRAARAVAQGGRRGSCCARTYRSSTAARERTSSTTS